MKKKFKTISISVTELEYVKILEEANRNGQSISSFCKQVIFTHNELHQQLSNFEDRITEIKNDIKSIENNISDLKTDFRDLPQIISNKLLDAIKQIIYFDHMYIYDQITKIRFLMENLIFTSFSKDNKTISEKAISQRKPFFNRMNENFFNRLKEIKIGDPLTLVTTQQKEKEE